MIGKIAYKLKSNFRYGLRAAYFRDIVRPRILDSEPVLADERTIAEIHVLTSDADWLNLIWALKSFYWVSNRKYGLCIHDDGSLGASSKALLRQHFPKARILDRRDSDKQVLATLSMYPRSRDFRKTNHLSPKVFDFRHHLEADRMLLLDSDILFFSQPTELLRRIEDSQYKLNSVNGDVASAYTVDPKDARQQCNVDLIERYNSGLGVIHRDSMNLDWIEEFLALPNVLSHFWRIEQTLYALFSSRYGAELLPEEYDVFLSGELRNQPSRHYVGAIRHLMYSEGIRKLSRELGK